MVHPTPSQIVPSDQPELTHADQNVLSPVLRGQYNHSMQRLDLAPLGGKHPECGLLGAMLQDGTREWRDELKGATLDELVWQPFERAHSIGALILHIIDVEAWWMSQVTGKRRPVGEAKLLLSDEIHQYGGHWPAPPREPLEWYFALHDKVRARTLASVAEIDDPGRIISKPKWNAELTPRWIVAHIIEHESYHGGQAVLLKLLHKKLG
jgi:uncharacterized damage-inducible protein DinB